MNRSPLSDFNRRRSLFDSPNLVRFINKTLHSQDKIDPNLNSTYSSYNPHRVAITRKLTNMNEQSPLQLNRGTNLKIPKIRFPILFLGIIELSLITSDNHLTVKSKIFFIVYFK
jgi:hypothetical protein